jgi:hypothetical protein
MNSDLLERLSCQQKETFPALNCLEMESYRWQGFPELRCVLLRTLKWESVNIFFWNWQDPKPLAPPPMKLTGHMVQAMGGANSAGFDQFRRHCHSAYLVLRR